MLISLSPRPVQIRDHLRCGIALRQGCPVHLLLGRVLSGQETGPHHRYRPRLLGKCSHVETLPMCSLYHHFQEYRIPCALRFFRMQYNPPTLRSEHKQWTIVSSYIHLPFLPRNYSMYPLVLHVSQPYEQKPPVCAVTAYKGGHIASLRT